MEMEDEAEGPSLPSNYVTIRQLRDRWLQNQNPQLPNDSQFNPKPHDDPALKRLPRRRRNRHRQLKPEVTVTLDDSHSKTKPNVADDHPKGEKKEHDTHHSNSNSMLSKKKKGFTAPKPRFVAHQNPNGPLMEPVEGKRRGGRREGNRKVVDKMAPLTQNVGDLSLDDAPGVVIEPVTAAVKQSNVREGTNRRGGSGSGRFQGKPKPEHRAWKPPFWAKKGQTSLVWVKKGESATN